MIIAHTYGNSSEIFMKKKNSTPMYVVALLLFLSGAGYLVYSGLTENSVYFLNVSEALAVENEKLKAARLFGTVASEDLQRMEQGPGVIFRLMDKDNTSQTLVVRYQGAVPDTFKAGAEVIVEGGINGEGVFAAKTLMTKCPSKYEKENRQS